MPSENCYRYTATTYLKQKGRFAKFFNVILTSTHLQYVELEKVLKKFYYEYCVAYGANAGPTTGAGRTTGPTWD